MLYGNINVSKRGAGDMIYEFRITLKDVGVPVWRDVQISSDASLYDLHELIQNSFEWLDMHLYTFFVKKRDGKSVDGIEIVPDDPEEFESIFDVEKHIDTEETIADWFLKVKDKMNYVYDFGDNWEHEIVLTKKIDQEDGAFYPRCIDAKNLTPDEDSRSEIIMGELDLEYDDSEELIAEINDEIRYMEMSDEVMSEDHWPKTLEKAKEFQQLKPWEVMTDEQIFAIEDPITGEYLFCSVLGQADEMYGLAVYIGADGLYSLLDSFAGIKDSSEIFKFQRSLLLSFENRNDLEKAEYELIKAYDMTFRGKNAWPSFVSFEPGFYPWTMDHDEVRQMYLALAESIKMFERIKEGFRLPHIPTDEKILVRYTKSDYENFNEMVLDMEEILEEMAFENFWGFYVPSEFEIKQAMKKTKKPLNITVEFKVTYLEVPIQEDPEERPLFPSAIFVADHDKGIVYSHKMYAEEINPIRVQKEFLNMFDQLGGKPNKILTDHRTYIYLAALIEHVNVNIELEENLSAIRYILEEMQASIAQQMEEN